MTAWSLDSVSLLTHGVHYALVVVGLVGVACLLAPQLAPRAAGVLPRDDHARRVTALREAVARGALLTAGPTTAYARPAPAVALHLPVAVVASAAAAGVHAAMGPLHLDQSRLSGLFFAASALTQLGWTAAAVQRVTPGLLRAGVALNAGTIALWVWTRSWGLPLGLMPTPEPIGAWDLAAVGWEVAVVLSCVRLLRCLPAASYAGLRIAPWADWRSSAMIVAVASAMALLLLSLSGASG